MSVRRTVTPIVGGWRIMDEVDVYEGDHEWCPRYDWVEGVSETVYPSMTEASQAIGEGSA